MITDCIQAAALEYAKLNWQIVPLKPRDKMPLLSRWQVLATSDAATIHAWFERYPRANIGLSLGEASGLIDVEADDEAGQRTADELLANIATPTWDSSRGTHRLFQFAGDLGAPAVAKAGGLEIRIGSNGKGAQSMLPPSIHPSGKQLAWRDGLSPFEVQPQPIPNSIRELLSPSNNGDDLTLTVAESSDLADAPGVSEGGRNRRLFQLAGIHVAKHGANAELLPLAQAFGARCSPPLPDAEVFEIVQKVVQRHNAQQPSTPAPAAATLKAATPEPKQLDFQAFPVDALPAALSGFISSTADVLSCDAAFVALPILGTVAAAIGNSIRFRVNPDWSEPALLWCGIVGAPGVRKTPAIQAATEPLLELEQELAEIYATGRTERERQQLMHEVELKAWKQRAAKSSGDLEPPPLQLEAESEPRLWCDDATIEAMAVLLERNPRGLLLRRDELTAWLRSFSEYKAKGGDLQRWLSIHSTQAVAVDRKAAGAIHIWRPNVSIVGGIQPKLLQSFFGGEFVDAGLMQRFLLCYPPARPAKLSRQGVQLDAKTNYAELMRRLQQFPYNGEAMELSLSSDAFESFQTWFDYVECEYKPSADGLLQEVASKLVAASMRLGGIMQCCIDAHAGEVTADAMRLGVLLARWFLDEWTRIHELQQESVEQQRDRQLVDFVRRKFAHGVTPAELSRSRRDIEGVAQAEQVLRRLALNGWGTVGVNATAGRQRFEFIPNS